SWPVRPSTIASRAGRRSATATRPVTGSTATPSAPWPIEITWPAGGTETGGELGGSAAGGRSRTGSEPQPATISNAANNRAIRMQRAFQADRVTARSADLVPRIVMSCAAATVAAGLAIRAAGGRLGTALPPFVSPWAPRVGALAAVSAAVLVAGALTAPVAARRLRGPLAFATALFLLALTLGLALNLARDGTHGWYAIFQTGRHGSFEAKWEYLPGLPALSYGAHFFLGRFAELGPALPVNAAGHPPGLLLTLHG